MGLFNIFNKKEKVESEKTMPSEEQILEDAKTLRQDPEIEESELPDIICTIYSASKNIDLDVDYVTEILNKSKNNNLNN